MRRAVDGIPWLVVGSACVIVISVAIILWSVLISGGDSGPARTGSTTAGTASTQTTTAPEPSVARSTRTYAGAFSSPDRTDRCFATDTQVTCTSVTTRKAAALALGSMATYIGRADSPPVGGITLTSGSAITVPSGYITCTGASGGVTCTDNTTGAAFTMSGAQVTTLNFGQRQTY